MSEYKNLFKGTGSLMIIGVFILMALRSLAVEMSAGSEGFCLSLPFLLVQTLVIIMCYVTWYIKIDCYAADMMNIADMRSMAFRYMIRYMLFSFIVTALVAVIAIGSMLIGVLFVGIPAIYCISSVVTMCFLGNIILFILMRFLGLPNRITGI